MNKLVKNLKPSKLSARARVAYELHKRVPADWYETSVKDNLFQRFWHWRRRENVGKFVHNLSGNVLDIGSCDGYFTHDVLKRSQATHITGIDVLEHAVAYAKKRYARVKKLSFQYGEAHALPFKKGTFDNIMCLEALEHVEDPRIVLKEMKRVLKKNGSIYILIPAENMLFKIIWPIWTLWRGKIWKGSHLHQYEKDQVLAYMRDAGFEIDVNHRFLANMLQFVIAHKVS